MRNLKLSQEQIELILQALGIAETAFTDTHKEILTKLVNVRNNASQKEQQMIANYHHAKACEMADLNEDIAHGKLDD